MNEWWRNQNQCGIWRRRLSIGLQQCWVRVQHGDTQSKKFKLGSHNREMCGERFEQEHSIELEVPMEAAMVCKVNNLQCRETCGECNCRHHVEPRVQLCVPKEEPFPRPLKCIDVSRTTHTHLDVLQESRIDDLLERRCGSKFVRLMHSIHEVHNIEWKICKWFFVVRRLAQIRATARPEKMWPEIWSGVSKAAQRKEKQQWAVEEPTLDNARKLRCIFYRSGRYGVQSNHEKRAGKLEVTMEAAALHEVKNHQCMETCGESGTRKSKHACIMEAHESTRKRSEWTLPKDHEDRIAGKGFNSSSHYNLVHKYIPVPQAMKIPWRLADWPSCVMKSGRLEASGVGSRVSCFHFAAGQGTSRSISTFAETKQPRCSPDCMMGSTARNFSRTKSVESSSEIGGQRRYKDIGAQGTPGRQTEANDFDRHSFWAARTSVCSSPCDFQTLVPSASRGCGPRKGRFCLSASGEHHGVGWSTFGWHVMFSLWRRRDCQDLMFIGIAIGSVIFIATLGGERDELVRSLFPSIATPEKPMWNLVSKTVDWPPTVLSSSTARGHSKQKIQICFSQQGNVWRKIRTRTQHRVNKWGNQMWIRASVQGNDKESHWYKIVSPQYENNRELRRLPW